MQMLEDLTDGNSSEHWAVLLNEHHIYGSSRIGIEERNKILAMQPSLVYQANYFSYGGDSSYVFDYSSDSVLYCQRGDKRYELSNHLGNVLAVITDRRIQACGMGEVMYYEAQVVSITDYYPFGQIIENRTWTANIIYRYGFNGKEMDDEVKGAGNSVAFEARIYDSRLGKFLTSDPLEGKYPGQSTYVFAFNCPIAIIDYLGMGEGDDPDPPTGTEVYDQNGALIDVLNTSTNQRIMVNANEYTSYKETYLTPQKDDVTGEETTPNLSNESVADDFSKGVIDHMESMETENEGSDYIAYGTGENILYFYGTTEDVTNSNGEVRQRGEGGIAYLYGFDNGKYGGKEENRWIGTSGSYGNGALANGLWNGYELYMNSSFSDANGIHLGIRLTHVGSTVDPISQSSINVESTNSRPYIVIHFGTGANGKTNGCPAVSGTKEQTKRFSDLMQAHFASQKNIKLVVNLKGNANVTKNIEGQSHY